MSSFATQHEIFCRAVAEGASGAEAARQAGFSTDTAKQQAYKLLQRPDVTERVGELRSEIIAAREAKRQHYVAKLEPLLEAARQDGDRESALHIIDMQMCADGVVPGPVFRPRAGRRFEPRGLRHEDILDELD